MKLMRDPPSNSTHHAAIMYRTYPRRGFSNAMTLDTHVTLNHEVTHIAAAMTPTSAAPILNNMRKEM